MSFKFDSKKASNNDFAPIPEGNYECIIEAGEVKTFSTGTKGINFKLKVRSDVDGQQYGGRVLFGTLFFTESTEGVVHGFLDAIGTPEGYDFGEDYITAIKDYAIGRAISAKVAVETYQGKERNAVKYMNKSKVGGGKVDDPFAPQSAASNNDPFASSGAIEVSDDDLPF